METKGGVGAMTTDNEPGLATPNPSVKPDAPATTVHPDAPASPPVPATPAPASVPASSDAKDEK